MASIDVYNTKGKKTGKIQLPKEIFGAEINQALMTQAVRVYLANQRKAKAKTKRRGEIKGSTRKIYRQKGTGRARHGDRYAPIFVGGGIAHGPTGKENFKLKMPKKMRRKALFSALTNKLKEKAVVVVDGLEKIKPKTNEMIKIMENLKIEVKNRKLKEKISLVLAEPLENVSQATKNIAGLNLNRANLLNTYAVLNAGKMVFTKQGIKKLKETFLP
jgi:large subunit ribosomal protein L4